MRLNDNNTFMPHKMVAELSLFPKEPMLITK